MESWGSSTLSAAFDEVVLFSSADGVTAYDGTTGVSLWSVPRAVPERTDPRKDRIYLTAGSDLIAVNPAAGRVTATASGSAVDASAGMYAVRVITLRRPVVDRSRLSWR